MWRDMLKNHIDLSETHAEGYDSAYGSLVTRHYMDYERGRLHKAIETLGEDDRIFAIDVGCGTGRCTIELSGRFDNVIGLDFSANMIKVAKRNIERENNFNTSFVLKDVSTNGLGEFPVKASLINFAFGMGSFFEDINFLVSEIKRVLDKKGVFHMTFYNKDSFVCKKAASVDMGMSAIPFPDFQKLSVDGVEIPCNFYAPKEIRNLFGDNFNEVSFSTYPTVLPLIKEELLSFSEILSYCKALDTKAAKYCSGYYISAIYQNK